LPNLYATALTLLALTFVLNLAAIVIRARVRARLRG
jgi:ABC-type phosphate transport system permease subunit